MVDNPVFEEYIFFKPKLQIYKWHAQSSYYKEGTQTQNVKRISVNVL